MDYCKLVNILFCVYLISVIFIRWLTPYSSLLNKKAHSSLIALFLSAAADVIDFIEYTSEEEITDKVDENWILGIDYISII